MKSANLSPKYSIRRNFLSFFSMTALVLVLACAWQNSYAQQAQLSLADLLIGLRSKKATLEERNKLLTDAVRVRGITFALTAEIEKELETTGAAKELIEAIRQKSLAVKPTSAPPVPTATPNPTPPAYVAFQQQADAHLVKGEYDLAVADYSKVIELNPKNAGTYLSRGLSYSYKKSYDQAISDYNRGIELAPNESSAYFNRGESYEKLGETAKALADYQKAVEINPKNESAKASLKRLQDEQAKIEQAKAEQARIEQAKIEQAKNLISSNQAKNSTAQTKNSTVPATQKKSDSVPEAAQPLVNLGQLNAGNAVNMVTPLYSPEARRFKIEGQVNVQITLDEEGKVIFAKAKTGPGLLRAAAEDAARKSKFKPALAGDKPARATGYIIYDFKTN